MSIEHLEEHVRVNREHWDSVAHEYVAAAEKAWASPTPYWGIWNLPEAEVGMLPDDMRGMRAIELGCGTGYVSAWMARRGASVVGIDNSARQLDTARRLAERYGVPLELHHGDAESVPLPDGAFDFAISEYGAAIWCDPLRWIPEAHRLLAPGGALVFLGTSHLAHVTTPPDGAVCDRTLHRPYFGLRRMDWREVEIDPGGIEYTLPISEWFTLFRRTGFEVIDCLEPRAPASAEGSRFGSRAGWARSWPYEQVWKLRKRPEPDRGR